MSDKKGIPLRTRLKLYLAQKENNRLKKEVIGPLRKELKVTDARPYFMSHAETDGDLGLLELDD